MTDAFVFDAIRTPRGKGKKDGSLHEVKPVDLLAGLLRVLQQRHDLDTACVDDVVMGVVSPISCVTLALGVPAVLVLLLLCGV